MSYRPRIAWIGTPNNGGGVGGFCRQLLGGLAIAGEDITAFVQIPPLEFRELMGPQASHIQVVSRVVPWQWGRWYSRHPIITFISSFWMRRRSYRHLVDDLMDECRKKPFDVILQFSQIELFNLAKRISALPPIVLFPCVHAAGELRWHRTESKYALQSEGKFRHYLIRSNLIHRAHLQKSCCRAVHGIIGMSNRFNELIAKDYGLDSINQAVLYQPTDPVAQQWAHHIDQDSHSKKKIKLLFVGRISVRKGIEMIVDLSHRLNDLRDCVEIEVVGGGSFWSDYTRHLQKLNPQLSKYSGSLENKDVKKRMGDAHALLVPSHYEPGGIVVAEALSHGCAVICSDEVGSAERLDGTACRKFCAGNMNQFEETVRSFISDAQNDFLNISQKATGLADDCFHLDDAITRLQTILGLSAARRPISEVDRMVPYDRPSGV